MSNTTLGLPENILNYLLQVGVQENEVAKRCRLETAAHPMSNMQIAPEQGQLLAFLVNLIDATRILEIGVFTGYSSLVMASTLPAGGILDACDASEEYTAAAREYWKQAGVDDKIILNIGDAKNTLSTWIEEGRSGQYDLAFIDADKESELIYFEKAKDLVREGGLIVIDNAFWSGKVADESEQDKGTKTIRTLTQNIFTRYQQNAVLLPIADGVILVKNVKG